MYAIRSYYDYFRAVRIGKTVCCSIFVISQHFERVLLIVPLRIVFRKTKRKTYSMKSFLTAFALVAAMQFTFATSNGDILLTIDSTQVTADEFSYNFV